MQITIRGYESRDLPLMVAIWNEVVEDGIAFPQEELLTEESGREFFAGQSWCGVAEDEAGKVLGLYILHPNNVGRCGHICNAVTACRPSPQLRRGPCGAALRSAGFSASPYCSISPVISRHSSAGSSIGTPPMRHPSAYSSFA